MKTQVPREGHGLIDQRRTDHSDRVGWQDPCYYAQKDSSERREINESGTPVKTSTGGRLIYKPLIKTSYHNAFQESAKNYSLPCLRRKSAFL